MYMAEAVNAILPGRRGQEYHRISIVEMEALVPAEVRRPRKLAVHVPARTRQCGPKQERTGRGNAMLCVYREEHYEICWRPNESHWPPGWPCALARVTSALGFEVLSHDRACSARPVT